MQDIFNQLAEILKPAYKYTFTFKGRKVGAIGIFYEITAKYIASSLNEAVQMLYKEYEHVQIIKTVEDHKIITKDEFYNAY